MNFQSAVRTPSVTVEAAIRGLSFKSEIETVAALVPRLRSEGASAIIVLVHQGGFHRFSILAQQRQHLFGGLHYLGRPALPDESIPEPEIEPR